MALPILLQKLFANSGVGPKLRPDIIPDTVLKTTEQTGLTAAEKEQAQKNLGLIDALKDLCLEYGATQAEIDALETSTTTSTTTSET